MNQLLFKWIAVVPLAALLAGCGGGGPSLYPVKGTVTKDGKPIAGVGVTFTPTDKGPSSAGRSNSSGVFVLLSQTGKAGAVPGKHKVVLTPPSAGGTEGFNMSDPAFAEKMMKDREGKLAGGRRGAPASEAAATASIPEEYTNPSKTPLEYEVKPSSNEFDIPIP